MLFADLLYQPHPFQPSITPVWRFSMSTNQVPHLGSGLPILYLSPKLIAGQLTEAASSRVFLKGRS
jgi:hypothetical protein